MLAHRLSPLGRSQSSASSLSKHKRLVEPRCDMPWLEIMAWRYSRTEYLTLTLTSMFRPKINAPEPIRLWPIRPLRGLVIVPGAAAN
ncbi:unnamed protein product [Ciceribacter sp. T2.26MG-112.2]|nr:unnamed protein product [Ciceribacter naphthalenivorans]